MVDDHLKANKQLTELAKKKGLTVPALLDKSQDETLRAYARLDGAEFDRWFMLRMVENHNVALRTFDRAANGSADGEVRALAGQIVPVMRTHLAMARDVRDWVIATHDGEQAVGGGPLPSAPATGGMEGMEH
jgi:putative membrane protein